MKANRKKKRERFLNFCNAAGNRITKSPVFQFDANFPQKQTSEIFRRVMI